MIFQIDETLVSSDLITDRFACDLSFCKGICCVEGVSGAPLEKSEIEIIEKILPIVWDDLSEKERQIIKNQGFWYIDEDGDTVTSLVKGKECVFTYFDADGTCKCVFEKTFCEGKTDFPKPVSCHLYPVRVQNYDEFVAVNIHHWHHCLYGYKQGKNLQIPLYRFLKDALIRRFGENWYAQLEKIAQEEESKKI